MAFGVVFRNFSSALKAYGFIFRNGRRTLGIGVINKSGLAIAANKLVAISGYDVTSKLMKIVLADADSANLATDVWVTQSSISNNGKGHVYKGFMSTANLNTNSVSAAGDPVYLDVTAGAFTATAPTGGSARVQIVGYAQVKSATVGQIAWDIQPTSKFGSLDMTGVGFASGGSTVTQQTNKTTGVTINAPTGAITMNNASLGAGSEATFTVTNSFAGATDAAIVCHSSAGTSGSYGAFASNFSGTGFDITVTNLSAGSLSEAIVLTFVLVKGSTS